MRAPTIDGIPFQPSPIGGSAAFLMTKAPPKDAVLDWGGGWFSEVRTASRFVVVRGAELRGYTGVWRCIELANAALDSLSLSHGFDSLLEDPESQHLVGWREVGGRLALRVQTRILMGVSVPSPDVVVHNRHGQRVDRSVGRGGPHWHPSLRFFRLSQVTDDMFDSYRNLWLAMENLLDAVFPRRAAKVHKSGRPGNMGPEVAWLHDAFDYVDWLIQLKRFVKTAPGERPAAAAYEYLYNSVRGDLFHSKLSRGAFVPHERAAVEAIAERHRALTEVFLETAKAHVGRGRPRGFMFPAFFDRQVAYMWERGVLAVTDDPTPFTATQRALNPAGGRVVAMTARRVVRGSRRGRNAIFGASTSAALQRLRGLKALALLVDGAPHVGAWPDGELDIQGVNRLEVGMVIGLKNLSTPREYEGWPSESLLT